MTTTKRCHHWTHPPTNWRYMASGVHHITRDKCNFNLWVTCKPILTKLTASINMKHVYTSNYSPWGNFDSYFCSPSTGKSATRPAMDFCCIYTHRVCSYISHGKIKEAMDTNTKFTCAYSLVFHLQSSG